MALTDNLISYWKLDEASGNALDAHGTNDLADNNTVGTGTGKINGARSFAAASSEFFSHADSTDLSTGDIDFTFAAWVNATSFPATTPAIVTKWDGSNNEFLLDYDNTNSRFRFLVRNAANSANVSVLANNLGAPSTSTWYHIVAWHDSVNNQVGIAVNAGTANTTAHTGGVVDATVNFIMGARATGGSFWNGLIDEVGFWKRVLTSQERTDLYNGGSGLSYDDFGGGGGGTVVVPWPLLMGAI